MTHRDLAQQVAIEQASLRYWLDGRGYFKALRAWEFGSQFHQGTRKDGVTPEFHHQIGMTNLLRGLEPHLLHKEDTIVTIMLHDGVEDGGLELSVIEDKFGRRPRNAVHALSKVIRGVKRSPEEVMMTISEDPIASIAKGVDRCNNQGSMLNVFSLEKQEEYLDETNAFILPMMKIARKKFPEQGPAYHMLSHILRRDEALFRAMHRMAKAHHA